MMMFHGSFICKHLIPKKKPTMEPFFTVQKWYSLQSMSGSGGGGLVAKSCLTFCNSMGLHLLMGVSRQEYWSGLPFPSPGILPSQELNLRLLHCRQILCCLGHQGSPYLWLWNKLKSGGKLEAFNSLSASLTHPAPPSDLITETPSSAERQRCRALFAS